MSTLTGFLLARITEDEEAASRLHPDEALQVQFSGEAHPVVVTTVARVLVECEARRRIVKGWGAIPTAAGDPYARQARETAQHVFRCLALPYADHPDYDAAWRP